MNESSSPSKPAQPNVKSELDYLKQIAGDIRLLRDIFLVIVAIATILGAFQACLLIFADALK